MNGHNNFKSEVYALVKKIPNGKVTTYGQIALQLGKPRGARQVGWALHQNTQGSGVPCHRVVNRDGRLAPNFAFDGWEEQKRRLDLEGVKFVDKMHVDLREVYEIRKTK